MGERGRGSEKLKAKGWSRYSRQIKQNNKKAGLGMLCNNNKTNKDKKHI